LQGPEDRRRYGGRGPLDDFRCSNGVDHRNYRRLLPCESASGYSRHHIMMTQNSIDRTAGESPDNRVSDHAAESTFREVDDSDRAIPAIEFRDVTLIYDDRKILNNLSFKVMKG